MSTIVFKKKAKILKIAEEMFAELGFEATSTRDLAERANINSGMINYYFGSKENLFASLVRNKAEIFEINKDYSTLAAQDPWNTLFTILDIYVDKIILNLKFFNIVFREVSMEMRVEMNIAICELLSHNAKWFASIIDTGISKRVFKQVDVPSTIATIIGTISHSTNSKRLICMILDKDPETYDLCGEEHTNRIKNHLRIVLTSLLTVEKRY